MFLPRKENEKLTATGKSFEKNMSTYTDVVKRDFLKG